MLRNSDDRVGWWWRLECASVALTGHVCSQERLLASGRAGPVPAPDSSVTSHRRADAAQPRVVRYNVLLALRLPLSPTLLSRPATSSYVRPRPPTPLDPAWACPHSSQELVTHIFCSLLHKADTDFSVPFGNPLVLFKNNYCVNLLRAHTLWKKIWV